MKKIKGFKIKKSYSLLIVFATLIILGGLFSAQYPKTEPALASILSAQQLLAKHRSDYQSLTYDQKIDLISKIDKESNLLASEYQKLNSEIELLKQQAQSIQSGQSSANQKLASSNNQISAQTTRLNSLTSRLQTLNANYRDKNKQCNQLKGNPAQNCRNQLRNLNDNINSVKSEITSTKSAISAASSGVSGVHSEVSAKNNEIKIINEKVKVKQSNADKVKQTMTNLSQFRRDVANSTATQNGPNQPKPGCTDVTAKNWDSTATEDDGSCEYKSDERGCTDSSASNYDSEATVEDGSCKYETACECDTEKGEVLCSAATDDHFENDVPLEYWKAVTDSEFEGFVSAVKSDILNGAPQCSSLLKYVNASSEQRRNWFAAITYTKTIHQLRDKNKPCLDEIMSLFAASCGLGSF